MTYNSYDRKTKNISFLESVERESRMMNFSKDSTTLKKWPLGFWNIFTKKISFRYDNFLKNALSLYKNSTVLMQSTEESKRVYFKISICI
jgi:hypothetical protein